MKSTSSRSLRIAALSLALSGAFSGSALAAWNPVTGQADPAGAPAGSAAATAGQTTQAITTAPLVAGANPDAATLNHGSGAFPTGAPLISGTGTTVQGKAWGVDIARHSVMTKSFSTIYNYMIDASKTIYGELHAIYNYLAYGIAEDATKASKGLIGTIIKEHELDRKYLEEQLALNHSRDQTLAMKQAYATNVAGKIQDYRVCDDLVRDLQAQTSGGGGAVGRGGGGSVAKSEIEASVAKSQAGNEMTQVGHTERIASTHKASYCSEDDLKYKDGTARNAFGCTAISSKNMPDADARAQSIFAPAINFKDKNAILKQNLTYNADQKQAAADAITNIVAAFSPPAMPKTFEQTEQGKAFLAKTKTFNARISSAVHALSSMADRRVAMNQNVSGGGGTVVGSWDFGDPNWIETYKRVFGSQITVPSKLSEADSLRFEVYRRYYDNPTASGSWYKEKVASGDDSEKFREMLRIGSAQMLLMYNIHQRMEENNMIQAAILSHMINPVTKDELQQASKAAYQ